MRMALGNAVRHGEEGHAPPLLGTIAGGVGAVVLAIGAANDSGVLAIIGGIVLAVGLTATSVLNHVGVEYEFYKRLDTLEKK